MRRVLATLAAILLGAASYIVADVTTASASPIGATPQVARHYDSSEATANAAGASQCSLPVGSRQGAWFCSAQVIRPHIPNAGTCGGEGCWYYINPQDTEFNGGGAYGYGGTVLGSVTLTAELKWLGSQTNVKPFQFESSRGISSIAASGERMYFSSAYPGGHGVSPSTFQTWNSGSYGSYALVNIWPPNGYQHNANSVSWGGVALQWQWTDPSSAYPGTWWTYIISPKFQNQGGTYVSTNPPTMGPGWYNAGWEA